MIRSREEGLRWAWAALALTAGVLLLLSMEIAVWHPGYALGDEGDIITYLQRVREGMPFRWVVANGSIHKTLTLAAMSLWPGKLWASSVPGVSGLAVECLLLFAIGRRLAGPRAGFFALAVGLLSAFTLIRARVALSFCLFPAEWLFLFWLRPLARRPWAAASWGALLALCCFDYEAWLPMAALLLLLPLQPGLSPQQRRWELAGFALVLAFLLPLRQLAASLDRRRNASFLRSRDPESLWLKLWQLLWEAPCQPYMAPAGHGVLPLAGMLALPWGLRAWGRAPWRAALYILVGIAIALAGGTAHGLPAHRVIMAWPLLALLSGLAIDLAFKSSQSTFIHACLAAGIIVFGACQLKVWRDASGAMDRGSRAPIRDLKKAAEAAWQQSQALGLPLVTELHPLKGAQFRFLTGRELPLPGPQADRIVAYLPWDYLPALKGSKAQVLGFKEGGTSAPEYIGVVEGQAAHDALETEREQRPLLLRTRLFSLESGASEAAWLREHRTARPWARTFALDYEGFVLDANYRASVAWARALQGEALVSVRPLIYGIVTLRQVDPQEALRLAVRARQLDPLDARVRRLERSLLLALGRQAEAQARDREVQALYQQGRLLSEQ